MGSGRSPLHLAVEGQRSAVVELLLSAGAVVNQRSYAGHTPLYCALYRTNKEVQALLRASGATYTREDEEYRESEEVSYTQPTFTNTGCVKGFCSNHFSISFTGGV